MFLPLVVLVACLPGLYALNFWDLNPPSPWWGLRGLAVRDGFLLDQFPAAPPHEAHPIERETFQRVALLPPLFAWLEGLTLTLSPSSNPMMTVIPSYLAGALVVLLVYLHGRSWRGRGVGLVASVLCGFNPWLLTQMQQATPTTLALALAMGTLYCHGRLVESHAQAGGRGRSLLNHTLLGGLLLALTFLAGGLFALTPILIIALHLAYLSAETQPSERPASYWTPWRRSPLLVSLLAMTSIGLILASPWFLLMIARHGWSQCLNVWLAPPASQGVDAANLLDRLVMLAPLSVALGLFAAGWTIRAALATENDNRTILGGTFWVVWLAFTAVAPAFWPGGPPTMFDLAMLIPLNLLAASAITDLANRSISIRRMVQLAPATALAFTWSASSDLRQAAVDLFGGRASHSTALGLHIGLDLVIILVLATRGLERWARRREDRQRLILGGFLLIVLAATAATGLIEVRFRHRETRDLLELRAIILRRHLAHPFEHLVVIRPLSRSSSTATETFVPGAGGRLRFILQTTLRNLTITELDNPDELALLPPGQKLVILLGSEYRLSRSTQARYGLEAIHPGRSGLLDVFATSNPDPTARLSTP